MSQTIEDAFSLFVRGRAAAIAKLGNQDGTVRLYYLRAPDRAVEPYGVFRKITGSRAVTHGGKTNLAERRLQLAIHGADAKAANDAADAIADDLDGYSGPMDQLPKVDVVIDNEIDNAEPETRMLGAVVDLLLTYRRV
jgi:hypothetical protein